jgi:HK97 family phage major capsid protein
VKTDEVKAELEEIANGVKARIEGMDARIDELDVRMQKAPGDRAVNSGLPAVDAKSPFLALQQKAAPHFATAEHGWEAKNVRFGALVAAMAGGEVVRKQLEADEQKALFESVGPSGGYTVPEAIGSIFIDAVRPRTRVLEAGARTYPMEAPRVDFPGWDDLVTGQWRSEGGAFGQSAPTIRRVTLDAKTCGTFVDLSIELIQDAGSNVGAISQRVEEEMGRAIAQAIDLAALHGAGSADEPLGLYNNALVTSTILGGGANGAAPTDYGFLLDAMYVVESSNFTPSALIWAPRTANTLRKLATGLAGDKTQLRMPQEVAALNRLATNQVAIEDTVGTSTDCSSAFLGDYTNMVVGFRPQIGVQTLSDPYTQMAASGTVRLYAWVRADVVLLQPQAFTVVQGIRP